MRLDLSCLRERKILKNTLSLIFAAALITLFISQSNETAVSVDAEVQSGTSSKATLKEESDFAYKVLVTTYDEYTEDIFKTTGFGLLVIGWLFTSDKSRQFLQDNRNVRITVLIAIVLMSMIILYSLYQDHKDTNEQWDLLNNAGYVPNKYFQHYRVTYKEFIGSMLISFSGFAVTFVSVYSLGKKR